MRGLNPPEKQRSREAEKLNEFTGLSLLVKSLKDQKCEIDEDNEFTWRILNTPSNAKRGV